MCFFVLCNRHWFNKAPGPDPRGPELGVTYLPSALSSDAGYADLPLPFGSRECSTEIGFIVKTPPWGIVSLDWGAEEEIGFDSFLFPPPSLKETIPQARMLQKAPLHGLPSSPAFTWTGPRLQKAPLQVLPSAPACTSRTGTHSGAVSVSCLTHAQYN